MMHLSTQSHLVQRWMLILTHLNILRNVGKGWFSRIVGRDRKLALLVSLPWCSSRSFTAIPTLFSYAVNCL